MIINKDDSNKYCYDTIHLNKDGMEKFSIALGDYLFTQITEGKVDGKIRK